MPPGAVKKFKVDVFEHVTQVSMDLAPAQVWSFAVNGKYHRGGATMHGFAIASTPVRLEGGMVDHSQMVAKGGDLAAGGSDTISADLKPGRYELICHVAGHYQAGQKLPFEVTG